MPTEMKDEEKGGEDRIKKMKEEQQREIKKRGWMKSVNIPKPRETRKKMFLRELDGE